MRLPSVASGQLGQPSTLIGFIVQRISRGFQRVRIRRTAVHVGEQVVGNHGVLGQRSGGVGCCGADGLPGQDGPNIESKQGAGQDARL